MLHDATPPTPAKHTLDEIARKSNTDKASLTRNKAGKQIKGHNYAQFYERFFRDFKDQPITIMELGCGQNWNIGASLRMLKEYFRRAKIIGVDIKSSAKKLELEGFEIYIGDLSELDFLRKLRGYNPDIIIDDASHIWAHQILAISELFDVIPSGGLYVMEDINTSFSHLREKYSNGSAFSGYDFVRSVCDTIHSFELDHLNDTLSRIY